MRNISLRSFLGEVEPDRFALLNPHNTFTYRDLIENRWTGGPNPVVAVFCSDLASTTKVLVALDGIAKAVCVIPAGTSSSDLVALLQQWSFDTVIIDHEGMCRAEFEELGLVCLMLSDALEAGLAMDAGQAVTQWLIPTSGTTATPKLVVHTLESIARVAIRGRKSTEPPQVWAMLYDLSRFAGYQVFFQALLSGHRLVFSEDESSIDQQVAFFADVNVTHISATPTLWRKILMSPAHDQLLLKQITLGGEAADQPTLSALGKAFPEARITHIFASTEAGVGMAVSDGRAGFPISYTHEAFGGVEIRLSDNRLYVRSASGADCYAAGTALKDCDGWVDTGDLVHIEDDRFFIIGRESGIINVGGDKVVPEQVRDVILACEIVQEAVVYGKKNPFTGAIVAADIVLRDPDMSSSEARDVIAAHVTDRLSSTQNPRFIRFVPDIKVTSTGKVMTKP